MSPLDLIAVLGDLRLPTDDFVVFGSAPLWAHGLRESISDLDVVARGGAWTKALLCAHQQTTPGPYWPHATARFWGNRIEVTPGWITPDWDVDTLIDTAKPLHGVRFARLEEVLVYKRILNRPKDQADIIALEQRLHIAPATIGVRLIHRARRTPFGPFVSPIG